MNALAEKLKGTFGSFIPLSNDDWQLLSNKLEVKKINKGYFFIKQGQICNHIRFLIKGIVRVYSVSNGKEITAYHQSIYKII